MARTGRYNRFGVGLVSVALAALGWLLIASPGSAAGPALTIDILSATPKTVTASPVTGEFLSVKPGLPPESTDRLATGPTPMIGTNTNCSVGRACWHPRTSPYPNQAFYGAPGAVTGPWSHRGDYESGDYTVRGCWTYQGNHTCASAPIGPHSYLSLGGATVTGNSFRIY